MRSLVAIGRQWDVRPHRHWIKDHVEAEQEAMDSLDEIGWRYLGRGSGDWKGWMRSHE